MGKETEEIIRKFIDWIKLKTKIHLSEKMRYPKERQIWWASLGQNVGVEINGKHEKFERPVLVVKRYNFDGMLILPITSKTHKGRPFFNFIDSQWRNNTAILSQAQSISVKRFLRSMCKMSSDDFVKIKQRLKDFLL